MRWFLLLIACWTLPAAAWFNTFYNSNPIPGKAVFLYECAQANQRQLGFSCHDKPDEVLRFDLHKPKSAMTKAQWIKSDHALNVLVLRYKQLGAHSFVIYADWNTHNHHNCSITTQPFFNWVCSKASNQ